MKDDVDEVPIFDPIEVGSSDDLLDICESLADGVEVHDCSYCGATVIDGEVNTCLGSSNDCPNMITDDFSMPPGHPLKFD